MLLSEVEYAKPSSVAQALAMLAENDGARALAGGQTLINVMKARAASPGRARRPAGLDELKGIELAADGTLSIGPMTTYTELVESAEAKARPILGEVCAQIADVQVRNRGTIGGNLCSNDPTNHLPPLMVSIGARSRSPGRRRADRSRPTILPRRLPDRRRPGRAADEDHDPGRQARRLRRRHARRRRHVHRRTPPRASTAPSHRARLRRRGAGAPRSRRRRTSRARSGARRRAAPAGRRARVERVPAHLAEVLAERAARQAAERS